jgi:hypothetical protein
MSIKRPPLFSPARTVVIASHTFTQLVRMKVFYFLAFFAVVIIASNFLILPQFAPPETGAAAVTENQLRMLKSAAMGTMKLFSIIFAIVSTALLLPKDVEDRTLYTILAKPVPRLDYLLGKLLGVLALIFVSLALMDLLMSGMLAVRANMVLASQMQLADQLGWSDSVRDSIRSSVAMHGVTASLQAGVFAIFLQSAVVASMALFISTFATSTLFTTITATLVYFIGNFQAEARDYWLASPDGGQTALAHFGALALALVFPDFGLFNVIDTAIEGLVIPLSAIASLTGIAVLYTAIYVVFSWFVFSNKEF